jgi:NADH dehydrogenase/NADH:ubiquinone oxidoreductase subunit G
MIHLTIDGQTAEYSEKITILEAARGIGVHIPTLCHNDYIKPYGGCRLCLVEVATERWPDDFRMMVSCCTPIVDGHIVRTDTERVKEVRKFIMELLLARCPDSKELQKIAKDMGVPEDTNALDPVGKYLLTRTEPVFDTNCILCGLCVRVCAEVTERHALSFATRGMKRKITAPFYKIAESCIGCGSCAYVCPTKTITVEEAP